MRLSPFNTYPALIHESLIQVLLLFCDACVACGVMIQHFLHMLSVTPTDWSAVAQWIERATDNRVVAGSNPAEAVWKLWQFPLPHFASVFRKRH